MGVTKMGEAVSTAVCDRCGEVRATVAGWTMPCAACSVARTREQEAMAATLAAEAVEGRKRQRWARWAQSVPARFQWTLDPSEADLVRVPAHVRTRLERVEAPATRCFVGAAGAGKTSAAGVLVSRWAKAGALCLWVSVREIDELARQARLGTEMPRELTRLRHVEALLLDDVGTEGTIGTEELVRLIHARHDDNLATVSTTGLSRAQLATRYGDGITRRLLEAGAIVVAPTQPTSRGAVS